MANLEDVLWQDATAQAELVRKGEVRAAELVDAAFERIERVNPTLNAVVTPMYEQARAAAEDPGDGPFAGVPFLLKDLVAPFAGVRLTHGARILRDFVADHDSELVARLKRAGLVVLGKTNTPEFGLLPTTEPHLFGPSRNPWDTERTPGGSSGGSAAAVAAGLVAMAHANDGGGSIRIPASCCGVFGLKPTRARNSLGPYLGESPGGLAVEHAVTRSVRDSAALLDATAGPAPGDPYVAPRPERPFSEEVGADPGRLKVGFTTRMPVGMPVHADCAEAVQAAAALCRELGHEVDEASPEFDGELFNRAFVTVFTSGLVSWIDSIAQMSGQTFEAAHFEPYTWAAYEMASRFSASDYLLALGALHGISRQIAHFFEAYDVWLTPTLGSPPVPLGTFDFSPGDDLQAGIAGLLQFVPFTPICNATGQPAMSVPLFWNGEGLPVGTHFVGRYGDEATLFRLAAQLEAARPWAGRRPPAGG